MLGMARPLHAMRLQPAEAARISEEFGDGERLAPHHQHDTVEPGAVERRPVRVAERTYIDLGGDGADAGIGAFEFHEASLRRCPCW